MAAMRPTAATFALAIMAGAAAHDSAAAHPHVWVTMATRIDVDPQHAVTGLTHRWTFDELYSSFATQGLDTDGDGIYTRAELQGLADINVQSLKDFQYFTFAKLGETSVSQTEPVNYWVEYTDGVVTLNLTVPFVTPIAAAQVGTLNFAIYDPSNYVAFAFAKDAPVTLANLPACAPVIIAPAGDSAVYTSKDETFFEDPNNPIANFAASYAQTVAIQCKPS